MSSADNLCKQFGPRSGLAKHQAWSGPNCLTLWGNFRKSWFWKKNQQTTKNHKNYPACKDLTNLRLHIVQYCRHSRWSKYIQSTNLSTLTGCHQRWPKLPKAWTRLCISSQYSEMCPWFHCYQQYEQIQHCLQMFWKLKQRHQNSWNVKRIIHIQATLFAFKKEFLS